MGPSWLTSPSAPLAAAYPYASMARAHPHEGSVILCLVVVPWAGDQDVLQWRRPKPSGSTYQLLAEFPG